MISGQRIRMSIPLDQSLIEKENKLREVLGTSVKIVKRKNGGKIVIEFYNDKDLDNLIQKLLS
jgi:ParB family chromosome partitioning protein